MAGVGVAETRERDLEVQRLLEQHFQKGNKQLQEQGFSPEGTTPRYLMSQLYRSDPNHSG